VGLLLVWPTAQQLRLQRMPQLLVLVQTPPQRLRESLLA
jgi:hypothetical protein